MATKQVIFGGTSDIPYGGEYQLPMGNGGVVWGAEVAAKGIISTPGKLTNFKFGVHTAPGAGSSYIFTIRVNGANTALQVTIANLAVLSNLSAAEVVVAAGDTVTIGCSVTGAPANAGASHWTLEFIPTTAGETIFMSNLEGGNITSGRYSTLIGGKGVTTSEYGAEVLFPCSGTLKYFYGELEVAPGAGCTRTLTIRKNGVATALAITFGAADTTKNNVADTVAVAAGDRATIIFDQVGAAAPSTCCMGVCFVPDTPGQFMTSAVTQAGADSAVTNYEHLTCGMSALTGTEWDFHNLARACTAKAIYVRIPYSPGAGNSYDYTLRRNAALSTALTCQIAGAALTCNLITDVAILDDDLLDTMIVPTSNPTSRPPTIAYLFYIAPTGGGGGVIGSGGMGDKMIGEGLI